MSDRMTCPSRLILRQLDRFPVHSGQDFRLSWAERLARNAASSASPSVSITLFGIPEAFAEAIGLSTLPRIAQRDCGRANPDRRSESRSELDVDPVRERRISGKGTKKAEDEEKPGKKAMRCYSEQRRCPRRKNAVAGKRRV